MGGRWTFRALAVLVLAGGLAIAFGQQGATVARSINKPLDQSTSFDEPFNDYRDTGYLAGRDVRDGENPYDHVAFVQRHPTSHELDLYGPQWFLVQVPLSLLSFVAAKVVWVALLLVGALLLAHFARQLARRPRDVWADLLLAGLILGSAAGKNAIFLGQPVMWYALAVVVVLAAGDKRPWLGGAALAVAMVKPQVGVLLALLIGFGFGWWRLVLRGVVVTIAAALVPLLFIVSAAGGPRDFMRSVTDNASYVSDLVAEQATEPLAERLDVVNTSAKLLDIAPTTGWLAAELVVAIAGGIVGLRRRHRAVGDDVGTDVAAMSLLAVTLLVGAFHPLYDALLLFIPLVLAWAWWRDGRRISPLLWAVTALLAVPLVYFPPVQTTLEKLGASPTQSRTVSSIALTLAFVLAV
ncbi:MAG: hypothetical protein QOE63_1640, partial [Acidimicrobiaceae bacterium]